MPSLSSFRANIRYRKELDKEQKEQFIPEFELIFLVNKPKYDVTNEGQIIRSRAYEDVRFGVSEEGIDMLIDILKDLKKNKDKALKPE